MKSKIKFEYRITAAYLIIGGLWIIFSDRILDNLVKDHSILTEIQTYKGWFYVVVTAFLFYSFLKKHLERIRKAEHEARESDRLKTAFLQNISHEIRTPMNGIIGFSGLLKSNQIPENQKEEYLNVIIRSSNKLLTTVNDILDFSLIETGNSKLNKEIVNINDLMDKLFQTYKPIVKKDIQLTLEKGLDEVSAKIFTDGIKLRQTVNNLLDNANKFTEKGAINFGYTLNHNNLEFYVKDSGIGISNELQQKIFERFRKEEKNNFKLYDGVGLGLAICKGNIDLMGGEIAVKSEINKGATFLFTIPYNPISNSKN